MLVMSVALADLHPGQKLHKTINDADGRVLLRAGVTITLATCS